MNQSNQREGSRDVSVFDCSQSNTHEGGAESEVQVIIIIIIIYISNSRIQTAVFLLKIFTVCNKHKLP